MSEKWEFRSNNDLYKYTSGSVKHTWIDGTVAACSGHESSEVCIYGQVWVSTRNCVSIDGTYRVVKGLF